MPYDFTSIINIEKGSKYTHASEYIIPSFSGLIAYHQFHTPEGHSRYAIILGLFILWHIIPIINLCIFGPKTFETTLAYWLDTCPVPDCIRNHMSNFNLLRKSPAEAADDQLLLVCHRTIL